MTYELTTTACLHRKHEQCPGRFVLSTPPMEGIHVCACPCHDDPPFSSLESRQRDLDRFDPEHDFYGGNREAFMEELYGRSR